MPVADLVEPFALSDFAQWRLLEGLDDIALTLRHETSIEAFEASRPTWLPLVASGQIT
jgi:3-isopropylmalate/(R)-2-methylmalate dehydratase small subunit